jgi:hypothetical protein
MASMVRAWVGVVGDGGTAGDGVARSTASPAGEAAVGEVAVGAGEVADGAADGAVRLAQGERLPAARFVGPRPAEQAPRPGGKLLKTVC